MCVCVREGKLEGLTRITKLSICLLVLSSFLLTVWVLEREREREKEEDEANTEWELMGV